MHSIKKDGESELGTKEIEEFKLKKQQEKKMKDSLKEILLYCLFVWVLFIVSYTKIDKNGFTYQTSLRNVFGVNNEALNDVKEIIKISI